MKRIGMILLFLGIGILAALGISQATGVSLKLSAGIASAAALLVYLMLDRQPEANPGDGTIIRLTRPQWARRKR